MLEHYELKFRKWFRQGHLFTLLPTWFPPSSYFNIWLLPSA